MKKALALLLCLSQPSWAAFSHLKSAADSGVIVTSLSYTPFATNDAIMVCIEIPNANGACTPTASGWVFVTPTGATWTNSASGSGECFGVIAPNTTAATITTCGGGTGTFILIDEWSGNDTTGGTTTFDKGASTSGSSTAPSVSVTPANNNDMVACGAVVANSAAVGTIGGLTATKGADDTNGNIAQYLELSGGSGVSKACTMSQTTGNWIMAGLSIKPVAAAVSTSGVNMRTKRERMEY